VGQISSLIIKKLTTLANAHDRDTLRRKRKAITALFPFAALQERDQQYVVLDTFLHAAEASRSEVFLWHCVRPFLDTLFNVTSHVSLKRAGILASPYLPWVGWYLGKETIQAWAVAASTIPEENEVVPSIVDVLLQIASRGFLQPYYHGDVWSWLKLRPSLPPICKGRRVGSDHSIVRMVRGLKNIEVLKSYLLLIWSEWDPLSPAGFGEICDSIHEDFGGIEMHFHRADLVERLDHVLYQLDRGLEYLRQERPELDEEDLQGRKHQYGELREILLEENRKALEVLTCTPSGFILPSDLLTPVDARRIPLEIHVCAPSSVSVVDCPEHLIPLPTLLVGWLESLPRLYHQVYLQPSRFLQVVGFSWCGSLCRCILLVADGLSTGQYPWTFCFCDPYGTTRFRLMFLILAFVVTPSVS